MRHLISFLGALCINFSAMANMADSAGIGQLLNCLSSENKLGLVIHPFVVEKTYSKIELVDDDGRIYFSEFVENYFKNFENNKFLDNQPRIIVFELFVNNQYVPIELDFTNYPYSLSYELNESKLSLHCIAIGSDYLSK
jgi:hypothetical protein